MTYSADNFRTMYIRPPLVHPVLKLGLITLLLLTCFPALLSSENITATIPGSSEIYRKPEYRPFPSIYYIEQLSEYWSREASKPYWVPTDIELAGLSRIQEDNKSILLNTDILAFYGHPMSKRMGILGTLPIEELDARLSKLAVEYKELNGDRNIQKAFYIIYGTVWPKGDIGILQDSVLLQYIEYAMKHDILVFIDHQIGRFDPVDSLKKMLPYLRYPNVHLALDPEWRTEKPMEEIGSITAAEINKAQEVMENYIIENRIPGERMLVIHQFNNRMILQRDQVKSNFARVRLVHCADGFGSPALKRMSYNANSKAGNIPVKAFKLFYKSGIEGAGYDDPILTPREVLELDPRPYIIMYQ